MLQSLIYTGESCLFSHLSSQFTLNGPDWVPPESVHCKCLNRYRHLFWHKPDNAQKILAEQFFIKCILQFYFPKIYRGNKLSQNPKQTVVNLNTTCLSLTLPDSLAVLSWSRCRTHTENIRILIKTRLFYAFLFCLNFLYLPSLRADV